MKELQGRPPAAGGPEADSERVKELQGRLRRISRARPPGSMFLFPRLGQSSVSDVDEVSSGLMRASWFDRSDLGVHRLKVRGFPIPSLHVPPPDALPAKLHDGVSFDLSIARPPSEARCSRVRALLREVAELSAREGTRGRALGPGGRVPGQLEKRK